ncbi:MAG TPA: AI-2E family transporter [Gaiellaceae bacterium]|nr:AI-2E family transporter [Gaiellaceae bacterium]
MGGTAKRAAVATLSAGGILVLALALWKIKVVIALFFLGIIIAAAMRPGVDWLHRRLRVPRGLGVLLHFLGLAGAIALFLWLVVPPAIDQVQQAIGSTSLHHEATHSTGFKHEILSGLDKRLRKLPSGSTLLHPAVSITKTAFEALVGVFFMFAVAAYWMFERDNSIALVQSLSPRRNRRVIRDTWILIDGKLGAFVRGEILLILFVGVVLSTGFWAIGLPYWILVGSFAGIFEIVPVIGPLVAGGLAVGVGLTQSWHMALYAGLIVLAIRQLEDYLIVPRVMGHAVGLSPLVVLVSVTTVGILLGGFYVLLAIPIASVLATLVDVVLRDIDPADQEVPAVMFSGAKEEVG